MSKRTITITLTADQASAARLAIRKEQESCLAEVTKCRALAKQLDMPEMNECADYWQRLHDDLEDAYLHLLPSEWPEGSTK